MARFSFENADNYGGQGNGSSFFSLKNDKDTARVRFLYSTIDDVQGYAVHRVKVGDKDRYVNCLREYNEPIDNCPFCKAQLRVQPRLFIKLYNEDASECQIWDRSKSYFQRLASLASRYNPLCNEIVEVERSGAAGDMHTTYEFYPIDNSDFDLNSVECSEPLGTIILDKSYEDMQDYLEIGSFPTDSDNVAQTRTSSRENLEQPVGRRTPANTARRSF